VLIGQALEPPQDRRYVADLNEPIVDEAGQPVEALRDWKVTCIGDSVAILSTASADAVVRVDGR
jgi:hypothetical protein